MLRPTWAKKTGSFSHLLGLYWVVGGVGVCRGSHGGGVCCSDGGEGDVCCLICHCRCFCRLPPCWNRGRVGHCWWRGMLAMMGEAPRLLGVLVVVWWGEEGV
jgi:hypothetical protein